MDDLATAPLPQRLTADAYCQMAEAGAFARECRIELIDGDVLEMAPIGSGHEAVVNALNQGLVLACVGRGIVSTQNSLRLDLSNVPQPDFAVLLPRADFYATGERPKPADVLLLVEVADTSPRFDRRVKLPLYAPAKIPEFWIVDLKRRVVDVHREPIGDGYAAMTTHRTGERVALAAAPDIVVSLDLVFG